jgi:predicted trehalose synthase
VDAIRAVYARAADATWPDLQRIHGDLHLGQVLSAPDPRGWVFLDFEGEPLRPLDERSLPDVTLRDVAGMLRSFDYVAGALAHDAEPVDAAAWAAEARARFLEGYQRGTGADLTAHGALLDAFELDKAVYEVVYETRNRPDWVGIPLAAVARLVGDSGS